MTMKKQLAQQNRRLRQENAALRKDLQYSEALSHRQAELITQLFRGSVTLAEALDPVLTFAEEWYRLLVGHWYTRRAAGEGQPKAEITLPVIGEIIEQGRAALETSTPRVDVTDLAEDLCASLGFSVNTDPTLIDPDTDGDDGADPTSGTLH